jgi:hypothetical protein
MFLSVDGEFKRLGIVPSCPDVSYGKPKHPVNVTSFFKMQGLYKIWLIGSDMDGVPFTLRFLAVFTNAKIVLCNWRAPNEI